MLRTILHSLQQKSPIKVLSNPWATRQLSHSFSFQQQPGSQNPISNPSHAQQKDAKTPLQQFKASRQTYLAFLSWAFLFKLSHLRQKEIYVNCLSSIRKQLLKELKTLKGSQGNFSESQYNEIRTEFLKPYELEQGIKVPTITDPSAWRSSSQPQYAVLNPTSFTKVMLDQIQRNTDPLVVGNLGIGKSFNLWGFSYLSYDRFKLLYQNLYTTDKGIRDIAKLVQINYQFFKLPDSIQSQQVKQTRIEKVIHELKRLPLIVYYRLREGQSWKRFEKKLVQQFPYLQRKQLKYQMMKNGQNEQEFQKMSSKFTKDLKDFCETLLDNGFDNFKVVIDQASQYTKLLTRYYNSCQKMRKYSNLTIYQVQVQMQKTELYSQIKDMSDKINLLRKVHPYIRCYYSELAEFDIFQREHAGEYLGGFTKLYHKAQDNKKNEFYYGYNLGNSFVQNQMFTILTLFLQQRILKQFQLLKQKKVTKESFVSAINSLNIEEIVESSRGLKQFSINTTCLTITQALNQKDRKKNMNQIDVNRDLNKQDEKRYIQIVQLLEVFAMDKTNEECRQKLKDKMKILFEDSFKRIEHVNVQKFTQRITKRLDDSNKQQKKKIALFYSQLELVLAQSIKQDKLLNLKSSENKLTKKTFDLTLEHDEAFQGQFSGYLQGTIKGLKMIGTFDGTIISGTFFPLTKQNNQKGQGSTDSKDLKGVYGILQDGEFYGKLSGSVQEGILLGKFKGVFTGKHVSNQIMEDYWSKTPYEIKGKDYLRIATSVFGRKTEMVGLKQAQKLQLLTHQSLCLVDIESIIIKIPKHNLLKVIYNQFFPEKVNQQIRQYVRILIQNDRALQINGDEWLTAGLASLKGTLKFYSPEFGWVIIQMVNGRTNSFLHFLGKTQSLEKHFEDVYRLTGELKPGQGIGAMPTTKDQVYSANSPSIDVLLVFKTLKDVLHYCSFDFSFGQTQDLIAQKIKKHKKLVDNKFKEKKDSTFIDKKFFEDKHYSHQILVLDNLYSEFQTNQGQNTRKKKITIHPEASISRVSYLEFDITQLKNQGTIISVQAIKCKAVLQALKIKNGGSNLTY